MINRDILGYAKQEGIEKGRKVRTDCTCVESNIHKPWDSTLLGDCVRVLTRLIERGRDEFGIKVAPFSNHNRRAKRRMLDIMNAKGEKPRNVAYVDLIKITGAVFKRPICAAVKGIEMINLSFNKKTCIIFVFILVFCTKLYAAPRINSIEGNISNGGKITIVGNDFGANGPSIAIFDDFENGTDEQNIPVGSSSVATLGRWDGYKKGGAQIFFSNDYAWSGNLAYQGRSGPGYGGDGIAIIREFPPTKEIFGTWWMYFPTECEWPWTPELSYGWKQVWFHSASNHSGSDFIVNTIPWPDGGSLVAGNHSGGYYQSGFRMQKGQWVRMRVSWIGGGNNNGKVQIHYLKYNGSNTEVKWIDRTNLTNMSNGSDNYRLVELGAWTRVHPTTVAKLIFDDFYVATGPNAQARVEIGNKSTYSSCTNFAVITPDTWQNDRIQATVRLGSFRPGMSAYLFVVDAQGNASGGRAVTVTGDSVIVPTGLRFD